MKPSDRLPWVNARALNVSREGENCWAMGNTLRNPSGSSPSSGEGANSGGLPHNLRYLQTGSPQRIRKPRGPFLLVKYADGRPGLLRPSNYIGIYLEIMPRSVLTNVLEDCHCFIGRENHQIGYLSIYIVKLQSLPPPNQYCFFHVWLTAPRVRPISFAVSSFERTCTFNVRNWPFTLCGQRRKG